MKYVCGCVCVCTDVRTCGRMYVFTYVRMDVCMHAYVFMYRPQGGAEAN